MLKTNVTHAFRGTSIKETAIEAAIWMGQGERRGGQYIDDGTN